MTQRQTNSPKFPEIFRGPKSPRKDVPQHSFRGDELSVSYRFQVNLRGIIDLLSNHLYSSPQVFIRELLQNGADAIRVREQADPFFDGRIVIRIEDSAEFQPVLQISDNGIGLTEPQIHDFLATIGKSSKHDEFLYSQLDFIGQFGIGLLSCFLVSTEITVWTRSLTESQGWEWKGFPDGTYSVSQLTREIQVGTTVRLRCKPGFLEFFEPRSIKTLVRHFGCFLPPHIVFETEAGCEVLNPEPPPWKITSANHHEYQRVSLRYGKRALGFDFIDCFPIRSQIGEVEGIAYVLPVALHPGTKPRHRVYLKNMLLSEECDRLLPDWAFFVTCVVNANELRPTASRESFYEDEKFEAVREELGNSLKSFLLNLIARDPQRLQKILTIHHHSIKYLALFDDELFQVFVDLFPFQTTHGRITLGEYRRANPVIRYTAELDQFRQLLPIARSQNLCVINAGYAYDAQLLEKLGDLDPDALMEPITGLSLTSQFSGLNPDTDLITFQFLKVAEQVLTPFHCFVTLKKFDPPTVPALYSLTESGAFLRSVERTKEQSDELLASILTSLSQESLPAEPQAQICFNYNNPLIQKLCNLGDSNLLSLSIRFLYLQSLLMGHHPLTEKELALLNEGLLGFVQWGLETHSEFSA